MKRGDKQQTVAKERFICYVLEENLSFYILCINPILDALWHGKVHHRVSEVTVFMLIIQKILVPSIRPWSCIPMHWLGTFVSFKYFWLQVRLKHLEDEIAHSFTYKLKSIHKQ